MKKLKTKTKSKQFTIIYVDGSPDNLLAHGASVVKAFSAREAIANFVVNTKTKIALSCFEGKQKDVNPFSDDEMLKLYS